MINNIKEISMPVYTKRTILTYQQRVDALPQGWLAGVNVKSTEMKDAGKTDGNINFLDEHRAERVWLDQAAVDEWLGYMEPHNTEYNVVVTNIAIQDNPSGVL
jgi:hypothetical protein